MRQYFILTIVNEDVVTTLTQPKGPISINYSDDSFSDNALHFWSIEDSTSWRKLSGVDKVKACQIPSDSLKTMSTENLAAVCARYPLYFEFMVSNNEVKSISFMINSFNGLKELASREDGAMSLLELYSSIKVLDDSSVKDVNSLSTPLRLRYFELLLTNKSFLSQLNETQKELLFSSLKQKAIEKKKSPSIYRAYVSVDLPISERTVTMSDYYIYVYTPFRKLVNALVYEEEFSPFEKFLHTAECLTNYDVILIDSASRLYNCHCYAWNNNDPECWIINSGTNLSQYWTNDLYSSYSWGNNYGEIKVYYSGDHSAVANYGTYNYTSKWGSGPLVRHAPNEVPAEYTTTRTYYYTPSIIGPEYVSLGNTYTYRIAPHVGGYPYTNAAYNWTFEDEDKGGYIVSAAADSVRIFFNQGGTFQISCEIENYIGDVVHTAFFEPLQDL